MRHGRYLTDHLLTPENAALIIIDYQPIQVSSIRSMPRDELVFNIVSTAKAAVNFDIPIIHSTVNVATGRNKPPIQELQDVTGHLPGFMGVFESFDGFNPEKAQASHAA